MENPRNPYSSPRFKLITKTLLHLMNFKINFTLGGHTGNFNCQRYQKLECQRMSLI